jgi:small GTP-binding protein
MGGFSSTLRCVFGTKEHKVLMVGLDGAGKTTILYRLKLGHPAPTIPSVGFNVETVQYNGVSFNIWDVPGGIGIRPLWRHYFHSVDCVIFVIDGADRARVTEVKHELDLILESPEIQDSVLLILNNKHDLENVMSTNELIELLDLKRYSSREWTIQPTNSLTGEGLYEGLDWVSQHFSD